MDKSIEYKAHLSEIFSRASPTYDNVGPSIFSYFGEKLVEFAELRRGSSVLDIACGRGAVLFPASRAVLSSGEVIGIDISKGMIEKTRRELLHRNTANAQVMVMDAEKIEFPDSQFDYILCGLCLFFFSDLDTALQEFYRVLRPGGFIVSSTFKKEKDDELTSEWKELYESFKDRIEDAPEAETFNLDTEREIKKKLLEAGFVNPEFVKRRKTFYTKSEEEWWQMAWSHGHRAYLERIPTEILPEFKSRVFKIIRKKEKGRGIPIKWELIFSKAQKPAIT